jgi:hypothetical protein
MPGQERDQRLTLTVDWPEITIDRLARLTQLWSALIQSVSAEATHKRDGVKWVVTAVTYSSPLRMTAAPEPANDFVNPVVVEKVSHAVLAGIDDLGEERAVKPPFYSERSLRLARLLALEANPLEGRRLIVSNGSAAPREFNSHVVATVEEIVGPVIESYGSIEGRLQGLETHGRRKFFIWESLSGRRVRCYFDDTIVDLDELLDAYERRVSVSGLIRSKPNGRRISIEVKQFTVLAPDDALATSDEILRRWEALR